MSPPRKRITIRGRSIVRRVRSRKNTGYRPSAFGGRSFPLLKWSHRIFGNSRVWLKGDIGQ